MPRGQARCARGDQVGHAQQPGQRGAAGSDEQRRQLRVARGTDGQACHRQRHREDDDAEQAEPQAADFIAMVFGCHDPSIHTAVATSTAAIARLNHSSRSPCASQARSSEPISA